MERQRLEMMAAVSSSPAMRDAFDEGARRASSASIRCSEHGELLKAEVGDKRRDPSSTDEWRQAAAGLQELADFDFTDTGREPLVRELAVGGFLAVPSALHKS